jgi:hypothetical protein
MELLGEGALVEVIEAELALTQLQIKEQELKLRLAKLRASAPGGPRREVIGEVIARPEVIGEVIGEVIAHTEVIAVSPSIDDSASLDLSTRNGSVAEVIEESDSEAGRATVHTVRFIQDCGDNALKVPPPP